MSRKGGPHKRLAEPSNCEVCGTSFHPWPGNSGRFCSPPCVAKGRQRPVWGRIVAKLSTTDPAKCWLWTGRVTEKGYARIRADGRAQFVHVLSYERAHGPVPAGKELDHLCRVKRCANPAHLDPVIHLVNILRGEGVCARNARKTHCPQGHPYTEENISRTTSGGRRCRTCAQSYQAKRYQSKRKVGDAA
jgi:hypothetical protein